ncbi:MAG: 50S ribosomal protein L25/general stress protein Ctc [Rickettsiales bacterium]|nr:50S ribosomal protein L25/general stress protein Ctc [Rickettsiales bacterium]
MAIELKAGIRSVAGKGAARAIRKNKKIPAVIYGEKKDPVSIELDGHDWIELIKKPGLRTKLFKINTGSGIEDSMLMDIQYHPVSDAPIHVDFKRIDVSRPVNVTIPIQIINIETSRGIKTGGVLNFAVRKVAIVAKVDDIPESIVIDLSELELGGVIHGSDLKLPKGVSLGLHQAELAFAAITGKMAEEADVKKPAAAAPAAPAKDAKAAETPAAKPAAKK